MTKKVLKLQMVDKVFGSSSIEFMIMELLSDQAINVNFEKTYNIEFKYYSNHVRIQEMTTNSKEMMLAVLISHMLIDYSDRGIIKYLDN